MDFGQRLKALRQENSMTQEQLAKKIEVRRPAISGYETKHQQPDFERLCLIAEVFNVSTDYLLGRTNIRNFNLNNEISSKITPEEKKLLKIYSSLTNTCKHNLLLQAESLLNMQEDLISKEGAPLTPQKGA